MRSRGFTLLEVMVALAILAVISLFTVQAIQNALRARTKVQKDIDKTATLRDALRIMERDINMAFNYRDINIQLYNLTQKERQAQAQKNSANNNANINTSNNPNIGTGPSGTTPINPADYKPKEEKIYTQFIGGPEEISFTSLSNVRLTEDSPISSQAEIGYKIKSCRRRSTQEQSSKCLWRRVSNYLHEDITKYGEETVLLENVNEFKLRYLGPEREEEWVENWSSSEGADDTTRGKFPYAVEITLEVRDPNPDARDKTLRMTTVAAIRNPNNPPKVDPNAQGVGSGSGTGSGTGTGTGPGGTNANDFEGGIPGGS